MPKRTREPGYSVDSITLTELGETMGMDMKKLEPTITQSELRAAMEAAHTAANAGVVSRRPAGYFTMLEYQRFHGLTPGSARFQVLKLTESGALVRVGGRCAGINGGRPVSFYGVPAKGSKNVPGGSGKR